MTDPRDAVRPSQVLARHRDEVLRIAQEHRSTDIRVFGSVARGEDDVGSDIDLLVRFEDGASLFDQIALQQALSDLLAVPVDVVSEGGLHGRGLAIATQAVPL